MTEVNDKIAEAITEQWGERCPDFDADCACCQVWSEYDDLVERRAEIERLRACPSPTGEKVEAGLVAWRWKGHNGKWVYEEGDPIKRAMREYDGIVVKDLYSDETVAALEAERDEARKELATVMAERDRAQEACEQIAKRFTPRRIQYAPKDRLIIGVERPPYEETTFFYDLIWSENHQRFVTPYFEALNGATHFLDPRNLIGLPPQERLSREERKKANARNPLEPPHEAP